MPTGLRIVWPSPAIGAVSSRFEPSAAGPPKPPLPPSTMRYPLGVGVQSCPPCGTVTPNSACEVAEEVTSGKPTPNDPQPASPISLPRTASCFRGRGRCCAAGERNPRILRCDRRRPRCDPLSFLDNGAECVMEIAVRRMRSRRNMAARGRSPLYDWAKPRDYPADLPSTIRATPICQLKGSNCSGRVTCSRYALERCPGSSAGSCRRHRRLR